MPTLTVPDLDDATLAILRQRAAKAGRSVEDEVRQAIAEMVAATPTQSDPLRPLDRGGASMVAREAVQAQLALADAAAARLRESLRAANGGRLPVGMVEALLAERRAEVAREEEKYAQGVLDRVKWGLK